jgi:cardiolipin synthase
VRVFEYTPTMLHAKTLVVDHAFGAVGSCNMDTRSFRLNFEIVVAFYRRSHVDRLAEAFTVDVAKAREVARKDRLALPVHARLAEAGARLLSPLL